MTDQKRSPATLPPTLDAINRRSLLKAAGGLAAAVGPASAILGWSPVARGAPEKIVLGISWPNLQDATWTACKRFLEENAAKSNPPVTLIFTIADNDVAKQASDIADLISRNVNVIQIAPVDSKAVSSSVKAAHQAKIPVMSFLRPVASGARYQADMFVGNDTGGQTYSSAKALFAEMKKDGVAVTGILWVSGDLRDENSRLRGLALMKAAAEEGATVLQDLPGNWDPQQAAAVLAPALKAHPTANVLMLASDAMMSGVEQVLKDADRWYPHPNPKHMYFASVDTFPIEIELVRQRYLDADALFDVKGMCKAAIDSLPKLVAGEKLPNFVIEGPVFTAENVDQPDMQARLSTT